MNDSPTNLQPIAVAVAHLTQPVRMTLDDNSSTPRRKCVGKASSGRDCCRNALAHSDVCAQLAHWPASIISPPPLPIVADQVPIQGGGDQQADQAGDGGINVVEANAALQQLQAVDQNENADANQNNNIEILEEVPNTVSAVVRAAILSDTWTTALSELCPLISALFEGTSITPSICSAILKDILSVSSPIVAGAAASIIAPLKIMAQPYFGVATCFDVVSWSKLCMQPVYVLEMLLQSLRWRGCDNATFVNHLRRSVTGSTVDRCSTLQVNVISAFILKVNNEELLGNPSIFPFGRCFSLAKLDLLVSPTLMQQVLSQLNVRAECKCDLPLIDDATTNGFGIAARLHMLEAFLKKKANYFFLQNNEQLELVTPDALASDVNSFVTKIVDAVHFTNQNIPDRIDIDSTSSASTTDINNLMQMMNSMQQQNKAQMQEQNKFHAAQMESMKSAMHQHTLGAVQPSFGGLLAPTSGRQGFSVAQTTIRDMMPTQVESNSTSSSFSNTASANPCLPVPTELQTLNQLVHQSTKDRQVRQAGILSVHNLPNAMFELIVKGKEKDKNALKNNTLCPMQQFVETKIQTAQQYARNHQYTRLVVGAEGAQGILRKLLCIDLTFDWTIFSINYFTTQNNQFRLPSSGKAVSTQLQPVSTGTQIGLHSDFIMLITNICNFAKNTQFWNERYADENLRWIVQQLNLFAQREIAPNLVLNFLGTLNEAIKISAMIPDQRDWLWQRVAATDTQVAKTLNEMLYALPHNGVRHPFYGTDFSGRKRENTDNSNSNNNNQNKKPKPNNNNNNNQNNKPNCRDFIRGSCSRGNACPFHHPKICFDFQNGRCNKGNTCKYLHHSQQQQPQQQQQQQQQGQQQQQQQAAQPPLPQNPYPNQQRPQNVSNANQTPVGGQRFGGNRFGGNGFNNIVIVGKDEFCNKGSACEHFKRFNTCSRKHTGAEDRTGLNMRSRT